MTAMGQVQSGVVPLGTGGTTDPLCSPASSNPNVRKGSKRGSRQFLCNRGQRQRKTVSWGPLSVHTLSLPPSSPTVTAAEASQGVSNVTPVPLIRSHGGIYKCCYVALPGAPRGHRGQSTALNTAARSLLHSARLLRSRTRTQWGRRRHRCNGPGGAE